ncbi:hypothetical protein L9F63_000907, partial [Diploptera punctata]
EGSLQFAFNFTNLLSFCTKKCTDILSVDPLLSHCPRYTGLQNYAESSKEHLYYDNYVH